MSARDDFGSDAGRPGGRGGSNGGLANGGVGGGRGGGGGGGGAGRNGGYGSHTGLNTGNQWHGNTAFGRPGGNVQAYGTRRPNGQMTNLKDPYGRPLNPAPAANPAQPIQNRPPAVPGLLAQPPVPAGYPIEEPLPPTGLMFGNGSLWPGQAVTPPVDDPLPNGGLMYGNGSMWPGQSTLTYNPAQYSPSRPIKEIYDRVPEDPNGIMSGYSIGRR